MSTGISLKERKRLIDEEKTFRDKGYRSSDLSRGSGKPVYAVCEGEDCQREGGRGRWVKFQSYRRLCALCAHRTEEYRRKNSDTHKGENHYLYGKNRGNEFKMLMSDLQKGKKNSMYGKNHTDYSKGLMSVANKGKNNSMYGRTGKDAPGWKGGVSYDSYCKFFDEPLKNAIRNYFDNVCFECGENIEENKNRKMSVHHVNYQKSCGCDNTQFCIYVPLCGSCHISTNHNRWYWYSYFMTKLAMRNPNYYAYHIPVVFYDEPSYNYSYVFKKNMRYRLV